MEIVSIAVNSLKPSSRNARTHSKQQIARIANSIEAFGFLVPVLIDEELTVLAGHGRLAAARQIGLQHIPAVRVEGLSSAKKRAFMIAGQQARDSRWMGSQAACH